MNFGNGADFTNEEVDWIEAAVKAIVHRAAEIAHEFDHLMAELDRIRCSSSWHRGLLISQLIGCPRNRVKSGQCRGGAHQQLLGAAVVLAIA